MSFHRVAEGPESLSVLNSCLLAWVAMRQNCLSSALLCFHSCSSSYLTKMSVCACMLVCVVCVCDGGGGVQLMSSITFLVSLLGRHGDRGGDLHRQRDQKRTEHVLCQEQGEYFLVFVYLKERWKVVWFCSWVFWVARALMWKCSYQFFPRTNYTIGGEYFMMIYYDCFKSMKLLNHFLT